VQRSVQARNRTELSLEIARGPSKGLFDREEAGDRSTVGAPIRHQPRDHDLVTDVLIDVAPMIVDRVGGKPEHFAEKAMNRFRADPFGEWRRSGDVDEQKESLFHAWAVITAEHDVAQGAVADKAAYLEHEDGEAHEQERARRPRCNRCLDVRGDRRCEIGAEQHRDCAHSPPAEPASDDNRDRAAVDQHLHREGEEERHPFERLTEARWRQKDLGAEDHADDRNSVDCTSQDAEQCAGKRGVPESGSGRAAEYGADNETRGECAEE